MPYTNKRFEELDVLDDFLISAIAAVPEKLSAEGFCPCCCKGKSGRLR